MMLELADNGSGVNYSDIEYLLIPDPRNQRKPVFFREDQLYNITPEIWSKFLNYLSPFNDADLLKRVSLRKKANNYNLRDNGSGGEDGTDWVETGEEVVDLIDTVVGWFDGGSGGSGDNPGTYVSPEGLIFAVRTIGGQIVGFGVNPTMQLLIAFPTIESAEVYFPNLPVNPIDNPPMILPSTIPQSGVKFALDHPNQWIKKIGKDKYKIVSILPGGMDPGGNPTGTPGGGSGGGSGSDNNESEGSSLLLPLGLLALTFLK